MKRWRERATSWVRRAVATVLGAGAAVTATGMVGLGCAAAPPPEVSTELAASAPARVSTGATGEVAALRAELDELERLLVENASADAADVDIATFRLDHLIAELTRTLAQAHEVAVHPHSDALAAATSLYDAQVALGRALALSATRDRPANEELALRLFGAAAELMPERAEAHVWHGRLLVLHGDATAAQAAFERARSSSDAESIEGLDFYAALAAYECGDRAGATELLEAYLASTRSPSAEAVRLAAALDATDVTSAGAITGIRLGLEERSRVHYEVRGATWQLEHETLGFELGLPLSWQVIGEQIDDDNGGFVQIVAPPVAGANRQWRTEQITVWSVPIADGMDAEALSEAWLASVPDLGEVEDLDTFGRGDARRLKLVQTPFMEAERVGQAFVVVAGGTGFVVECWGDEMSFLQIEPQLVEIMREFSPLGA